MNAKQPFEKHLTDKLQKLNAPGDANSNWPHMKALLDREMPVGGNGGNRNRWWLYSLVAIILLTGAWFGSSLLSNDKKESTSVTAVTSPSSDENKDLGANGNKDGQKNNEASSSNQTPIVVDKSSNKQTKPDDASEEKSAVDKPSQTAVSKGSDLERENNKLSNGDTEKESSKINEGVAAKNNTTENSTTVKTNAVATDTKKKGNQNARDNRGQQVAFVPVVSGKNKAGVTNGDAGANSVGSNNQKTINNSIEENSANASVVRQDFNNPEMAGIDYPDSLQTDYALQSQLVTVKTRSRFKSNTDRVKGLKNRTVGTGDAKNFVVGLSLPMAFPLGEQTPFAYNHNAGPNTVSDYLPAPHMQYHFNQQSYLQAELQVLSPQYIQPALVYEKSYVQTGGTSNYRYITNSVYAKKLYYFSLPIGVHYSPFKNFYLGSGLQFSSLLSGVAQYESRGYNSLSPAAADTLFSSSVQKFKNDSISNQLSNNEFRMMLDANYYWHRFTVGLRYNQALSNFVSVQVNSLSPLYTDKNKSIQFYLRYNIWEDKKKKKTGMVANR